MIESANPAKTQNLLRCFNVSLGINPDLRQGERSAISLIAITHTVASNRVVLRILFTRPPLILDDPEGAGVAVIALMLFLAS
jgi:hypothetical protein